MLATFIENPRTAMLFSFSPTNCSPDEHIELFSQQQTDQIKQIPKQILWSLEGTQMFRLKRTILGNEYEKYRNRQHLLNMLTECELI